MGRVRLAKSLTSLALAGRAAVSNIDTASLCSLSMCFMKARSKSAARCLPTRSASACRVRPTALGSAAETQVSEAALAEIMTLLRSRTHHDFRHYKRPTMLPMLVAAAATDSSGPRRLRAWVVGCASGQEAYSIAMLLQQAADSRTDGPSLQTFATTSTSRRWPNTPST